MVTDLATAVGPGPEEALVVGGILGGLLGTFVLVTVAFYVLLVIADWKIFTKAGEKGWKSLIPIYNLYITFKIFWETKYFWISFILLIICSMSSTLAQTPGGAQVIVACLCLATCIASIVFFVMLYNRMSKSFGHGLGYTLGLIFLPNIFTLILGFNKDKYKKIKD